MSYKTDGSSHNNGVKSEKIICDFLNDYKNKGNEENNQLIQIIKKAAGRIQNIYKLNFKHTGTTQNIDDILEIENNIRISLKSKKKNKNKYSGTLDLINTSKLETICKNEKFLNFLSDFNLYKNNLRNNSNIENINKKQVKLDVNKYCNSILNSLTGNDIYYIFSEIKNRDADITLIRDISNDVDNIEFKDLHFLEHNWLDQEINLIDKKQIFNNNKMSSFIKYIDNTDSCFRIRIALNNGISALIGEKGKSESGKSKNKNSVLSIKIQVDKVAEIVKKYSI